MLNDLQMALWFGRLFQVWKPLHSVQWRYIIISKSEGVFLVICSSSSNRNFYCWVKDANPPKRVVFSSRSPWLVICSCQSVLISSFVNEVLKCFCNFLWKPEHSNMKIALGWIFIMPSIMNINSFLSVLWESISLSRLDSSVRIFLYDIAWWRVIWVN